MDLEGGLDFYPNNLQWSIMSLCNNFAEEGSAEPSENLNIHTHLLLALYFNKGAFKK